jgi:hypothetical protein
MSGLAKWQRLVISKEDIKRGANVWLQGKDDILPYHTQGGYFFMVGVVLITTGLVERPGALLRLPALGAELICLTKKMVMGLEMRHG